MEQIQKLQQVENELVNSILQVENFTFDGKEQTITYPPKSNVNYTTRLLKVFGMHGGVCSFEPDAFCDCRDVLQYANLLYILDEINMYLLTNPNIFPLITQKVILTDQSNISDYCSVQLFKEDNPFNNKFILEKEIQMVDFQNEDVIDFLATIYCDVLQKYDFFENLTSYFIASFLKQIIKFSSDDILLLYDIPVIADLVENEIPTYFTLFFVKQLYQYQFLSIPVECEVIKKNNKTILISKPSLSLDKYQTDDNQKDTKNNDLIDVMDLQILPEKIVLQLQQKNPFISETFDFLQIRSNKNYILIYQDMTNKNKLHSLSIQKQNSERYVMINIKKLRILKFDQTSNFIFHLIVYSFGFILFVLLLTKLFKRTKHKSSMSNDGSSNSSGN